MIGLFFSACMTKDYQGAVKCSLTGHPLLIRIVKCKTVQHVTHCHDLQCLSLMECGGGVTGRKRNIYVHTESHKRAVCLGKCQV